MQLLLELAKVSPTIYDRQLYACNFGEILQVFNRSRITINRVMRTTGVDPGCYCCFEIRQTCPNGPRHRQLRQRFKRFDSLHFVDNKAKAVSEINEGNVDGRPGRSVKHQAYRVLLSADSQGV